MISLFKFGMKEKEKEQKLQRIMDQLQLHEKLIREQTLVHQEEYKQLLHRQRKSEALLESLLEEIEYQKEEFIQKESIKSNEKALAGYILRYEEGLHQFHRILTMAGGEADEWAVQLHTIRAQIGCSMTEGVISIIIDTDVPIDFTLHEIIGVSPTKQADKNGIICEVITPGISYLGEVLKKAKVIAYKYTKEKEE